MAETACCLQHWVHVGIDMNIIFPCLSMQGRRKVFNIRAAMYGWTEGPGSSPGSFLEKLGPKSPLLQKIPR